MWSQESQQAFQLLPQLLTKLWQKAFFFSFCLFFFKYMISTRPLSCIFLAVGHTTFFVHTHNVEFWITLQQRAFVHSTHTFVVPGGEGPRSAISFLCWNIYCCYWLGCYLFTLHQTLVEPVNQSEAEFLTDLLTLVPTTPTLFGFEACSGRNQKHASVCLKLCFNIASSIQYTFLASSFTIFSSDFKITD